jgi:hypothetical protein
MTEIMPLAELVFNEDNPRQISSEKFASLQRSLDDFPEMLQARPIVVDEKNVILGGNMRAKAMQAQGVTDVQVLRVEGWSDEQKKQFIIKDNVGFGAWDWDMLANQWDNVSLGEWGLDVWQPETEPDYSMLDDVDDNEATGMADDVRKAVCIDFSIEQAERVQTRLREMRKEDTDISDIIMQALGA